MGEQVPVGEPEWAATFGAVRNGLLISSLLISAPALGAASFVDVSDNLDLNGDLTETWGLSWGDVNSDGYPDLYLSNHRHYGKLVVNQRNGTFLDLSNALDQDGSFTTGWPKRDTHAAAWGDLDNDGDQDLVISISSTPSRKLRNDGGVLVFETELYNEQYARQPLLFDSNNDGTLDVRFIARSGYACEEVYGEWGLLTQLNNTGRLDLICSDRSLPFPGEIVIQDAGPNAVLPSTDRVIDVVPGDFNGDLLNDMIQVTSRLRPNGSIQVDSTTVEFMMWVNEGEQKFLTIESGGSLTVPELNESVWRRFDLGDIYIGASAYRPSSAQFTLDVDNPTNHGFPSVPDGTEALMFGYDPNDGVWTVSLQTRSNRFDVIGLVLTTDAPITNQEFSPLRAGDTPDLPLYFQGSAAGFVDAVSGSGLQEELCASGVAFDFDNDMDLDLFMACRGGAENIANVLYDNNGDGTFTRIPDAGGAAGVIGSAVADGAGTSDSVAAADYNLDGFIDLAIANGLNMRPQLNGGPKQLFRNQGNGNNWLQFDLRGTTSNFDGVGATLYVTTADNTVQYREQNGGYHRWAQNFQRVHVGLAGYIQADVEVHWPSGNVDVYPSLAANQIWILEEGGVASPRAGAGTDTDGDGIPDTADSDDDNDGFDDNVDAFPLDPDEQEDTDGDGIGNNGDAYPNDPRNTLCGDPNFINTTDRGTFFWRDCVGGNDQWFLRTSGGGTPSGLIFTGVIEGTLDNLDHFSLESNDNIDDSAAGKLEYLMRVFNTGVDGIDFRAAAGCFIPNEPASEQVLLGEARAVLPNGSGIDLATGDTCEGSGPDTDGDGESDATDPDDDNDGVPDVDDAFPLDPTESTDTDSDGEGDNSDPFKHDSLNTMCGDPGVSNSLDHGTFVWRDCDGVSETWHLRVTGDGTPTAIDYTGSISTARGVLNVTEVSFEGSDNIDTSVPGTLQYMMRVFNNGTDGIDFETLGDEPGLACFAPGEPSDLPTFYGSDRTQLFGDVDLATAASCL